MVVVAILILLFFGGWEGWLGSWRWRDLAESSRSGFRESEWRVW